MYVTVLSFTVTDTCMVLIAQVNDCHLYGLPCAEVATGLRDLPQRVRVVCARRKFSADDKMSLSSSTSTVQRLVKAKSEQSLVSTSEYASLSRNKSKSLELLSKFGIWNSEPTEVQLVKGDVGLGFSILDDPVSNCDINLILVPCVLQLQDQCCGTVLVCCIQTLD